MAMRCRTALVEPPRIMVRTYWKMNIEEERKRVWEYDGILESGAGHDVSGEDVFLEEVVDGRADGGTFVLFFL